MDRALSELHLARISPAVAEAEGDSLPPRFSWNWQKKTLWARKILPSVSAMRAVEKIALASDAVTLLSRRHDEIALRIIRRGLFVWLARDRKNFDRVFVVTAYVGDLTTPGDHATRFVRAAENLTDFVTADERLRLLPLGRE